MLSSAALAAADRLVATLMRLVEVVGAVIGGPAPEDDAWALFHRLSDILLRLATPAGSGPTISRPPPDEPLPAEPAQAAARQPPPRAAARRLPRRAGWILDVLPGIAPAIAADLAHLLADPATTELLAADPALDRALRPILRGLGLSLVGAPPPPQPPSPRPKASVPPPPANRAARRALASQARRHRENRAEHTPHPSHVHTVP